ncbi:MAG: phage tail sheath subtilisin-like domain-containing protein [Scytonema sp. PMC 1069.18]|nr:phage tail sheath subtilisin-like domain-containing protein [Scytonema sp. PMC 1069.18]MEC4883953.1 phage tail sheath subtilisin-like domain-containing protein [Scytonema sp. PMC 1070.18]
MLTVYRAPGVYQEEIFLQPEAPLPTGIPGFVGIFNRRDRTVEPLANFPILLHRQEEFLDSFTNTVTNALGVTSEGYLQTAIRGFFENGGTRCYVVRVESLQESAFKQAIAALAPLTDLDLVAVPDVMLLADENAILRLQQAVLQHCAEQGDRFAILDALPKRTTQTVIAQRQQLTIGQPEPVNGALYYPWLTNASGKLIPPCGHVTGIFARSDRDRGVFKAPANADIRDVLDLEQVIDNPTNAELNAGGINCLRSFPGRGIRLWGARTLSRDPNWRYINVRRLFLTVGRVIERNQIGATFDFNAPQLWNRIQRELTAYFIQLWQDGALQGQTPAEAFYVKCDAETNPPEVREAGQVITEIGLAPAVPAEFIVVRVIQHVGATEIIPLV